MGTQFGFTNKTPHTFEVEAPTSLKPVTEFAKIEDEPTVAVLSNRTTPLDQGELLTFRCNPVDKVSTSQVIQHPSAVTSGVQYVVKLEDILRTTNSQGDIVCDEPIVMYLTVRHQRSSNISTEIVDTMFQRLIGACYHSDGTTRFDELMRSALVPTKD